MTSRSDLDPLAACVRLAFESGVRGIREVATVTADDGVVYGVTMRTAHLRLWADILDGAPYAWRWRTPDGWSNRSVDTVTQALVEVGYG